MVLFMCFPSMHATYSSPLMSAAQMPTLRAYFWEPMDIAGALESCDAIVKTLGDFPRQPRLAAALKRFVPSTHADRLRREELALCAPAVEKIVGELNGYIARYGEQYVEAVRARWEYISKQMSESARETRIDAERARLCKEIEGGSQFISAHLRKVAFDEEDSLRLLSMVHAPGLRFKSNHITAVLQRYVAVAYEPVPAADCRAYENILAMYGCSDEPRRD
ncbi:hypothetical protein PAPHI01_0296 [Pancytospora philotis]|nr:hypothetical protein PAPHI01_0296 [Pancytospora philotis]